MTFSVALRNKIGAYSKGLGVTFVKCVISGIIMSACVIFVNTWITGAIVSTSVGARLLKLALPVATGVLTYAVMVVLLKVQAVEPIINTVKSKVFRKM